MKMFRKPTAQELVIAELEALDVKLLAYTDAALLAQKNVTYIQERKEYLTKALADGAYSGGYEKLVPRPLVYPDVGSEAEYPRPMKTVSGTYPRYPRNEAPND